MENKSNLFVFVLSGQFQESSFISISISWPCKTIELKAFTSMYIHWCMYRNIILLSIILTFPKIKWSDQDSNKKRDIISMDSTLGKSVVGSKRSSKFVRSDALSPNSANNILIENELGAVNKLLTSFMKTLLPFLWQFTCPNWGI